MTGRSGEECKTHNVQDFEMKWVGWVVLGWVARGWLGGEATGGEDLSLKPTSRGKGRSGGWWQAREEVGGGGWGWVMGAVGGLSKESAK